MAVLRYLFLHLLMACSLRSVFWLLLLHRYPVGWLLTVTLSSLGIFRCQGQKRVVILGTWRFGLHRRKGRLCWGIIGRLLLTVHLLDSGWSLGVVLALTGVAVPPLVAFFATKVACTLKTWLVLVVTFLGLKLGSALLSVVGPKLPGLTLLWPEPTILTTSLKCT